MIKLLDNVKNFISDAKKSRPGLYALIIGFESAAALATLIVLFAIAPPVGAFVTVALVISFLVYFIRGPYRYEQ